MIGILGSIAIQVSPRSDIGTGCVALALCQGLGDYRSDNWE